ncbi:MAG: helix-turn-helix transcriptional regulator [Deltaproteobacteria bacterium]|nr:helix-turn-helix transcriptional regulator [Deltaproteobacteria bacterium]
MSKESRFDLACSLPRNEDNHGAGSWAFPAAQPKLPVAGGTRGPGEDPALRPSSVPRTLTERLALARIRLRHAAENGIRIRVYEVALDLDMSEFHFARQFRAAYGCSPHVFYDEIRATCARSLLGQGCAEGEVARRIGLRRPAELRALLGRRRGTAGGAAGRSSHPPAVAATAAL